MITVLLNPAAGAKHSDDLPSRLAELFGAAGVPLRLVSFRSSPEVVDAVRSAAEAGDDAVVAAGGDGIISVAANEIPALMSEMTTAALRGDFVAARKIHERILPLMTGNFIESNPIPVKAAMKMLGLIPTDTVRPPLAPLTEANRKKMESILRECGLSVAAAA